VRGTDASSSTDACAKERDGLAGTLLRFRETGFRDKGWEAALLEEQYAEHVAGRDYFLPRLVAYAARLATTR